jgi:hypothetical protein
MKANCEDFLIRELTMLSRPTTSQEEEPPIDLKPTALLPAGSGRAAEKACFKQARAFLTAILELCSAYLDGSSERLLHMLVQWLMPSFRKALVCRDVCAILYCHRDVLGPALLSHIRDRLVTLVMLSDDLVDEVEF